MIDMVFNEFPREFHAITGLTAEDINSASDYHRLLSQRLVDGLIVLTKDQVATVDVKMINDSGSAMPTLAFSDFSSSQFYLLPYRRVFGIHTDFFSANMDVDVAVNLLSATLQRSTVPSFQKVISHILVEAKIYQGQAEAISDEPVREYNWRIANGRILAASEGHQGKHVLPGWNLEKKNAHKRMLKMR